MNSMTNELEATQRTGALKVSFDPRTVAIALLTFLGYFIGAKIGFALTFDPHPVSVLWPPNSILVAGLLLTPPRIWWVVILAALPAHLATQLQSEVPPLMILCWFISNCSEALIGAGLARYVAGGTPRFSNLRTVAVYSLSVGFIGPALSSFLDAAFVQWNDWGSGSYWEILRIRFTSNVLAALTIAPLIVIWATADFPGLIRGRPGRLLEAGLLVVSLSLVSFGILYKAPSGSDAALLFAPLPFLLWAAIRFGAVGAITATSIVAFSAIWSAGHGHGPFSSGSAEENALSIQLFLIAMSLPLLFLAGVIEEQTRSAEKLRQSEERYREVVESQTDLVCRFLPDTTITFVNEAYCRFFGVNRGDLIGRKFLELIPAAAQGNVVEIVSSVIRNRQAVTHEHETIMPDGSIGWQHWIDYPIIQADGQVAELQGIGRDITDRVRAEMALREREARISLAAESANLAFWVYEPKPDAIWMSEKGRAIYGFGPNEPLSRASLISVVHSDERKNVESVLDRVSDCQKSFEIEHRVIRHSGEVVWVIMRGRCLRNEHGEVLELIGVTIDITEQKHANLRLEEHQREMAHLSRVAVMGEMAASLAHELNQPLTGIMSNADAGALLIDRRDVGIGEIRDLLSEISADVRRAGDVIKSIRSMVKRSEVVREQINVNELVLNVVRMVKSEASVHSCELETLLQSDLPLVEGNPIELQQVLVNLIMNAFDALRDIPVGNRKVQIGTRMNGHDEVEASVRDSGKGIARSASDRLFDQFFTTKPGGLGLGLSIARSIIEAHGGKITAENIQDGGSEFRFRLPATIRV